MKNLPNLLAFPSPICNSGDKDTISYNAANADVDYTLGFKQQLGVKLAKGGSFVSRKSVNGLAYDLSWQAFASAEGYQTQYTSKMAASPLNGYPKGARIWWTRKDTVGKKDLEQRVLIESQVANNKTAPANETVDQASGGIVYWRHVTPMVRYSLSDESSDPVTGGVIYAGLEVHTAKTDIHVSEDEKGRWNNTLEANLKELFPVGTVYVACTDTCPLLGDNFKSFGWTWTPIPAGKALWGCKAEHEGKAGDEDKAGDDLSACAPSISISHEYEGAAFKTNHNGAHGHKNGNLSVVTTYFSAIGDINTTIVATGAFSNRSYGGPKVKNGNQPDKIVKFSDSQSWRGSTSLDGSHSHTISYTGTCVSINGDPDIYKSSATTVQPPAYTVNMWKRTK